MRLQDVDALEALKSVLEHRAVDLLENVQTHVDRQVRCDPDDV